MKVYSGKSSLPRRRTVRPAGYILLTVITLFSSVLFTARATSTQQTPSQPQTKEVRDANTKLDREAKKALRQGKYEVAVQWRRGRH